MHKPIVVHEQNDEHVIDLYPHGDPAVIEAQRSRLHQIAHYPPAIYASEPSRSHTAEQTTPQDRAWAILMLVGGVFLINLPTSIGIAYAAGWGVGAWAAWFGAIQFAASFYLYRTQMEQSPAALERQRQELDHELRLQQQADAHEIRTRVVDHMLAHQEGQVIKPPSRPLLFVNDQNQVRKD